MVLLHRWSQRVVAHIWWQHRVMPLSNQSWGRQLPVCIKPKWCFYQFLWNYTFQVAVPLKVWRGKREKSSGVPWCLAKKFRAAWCSSGRQEDPLSKPIFRGQWDGSVGRGSPPNLMNWVLLLSLHSKRKKTTPVSSLWLLHLCGATK